MKYPRKYSVKLYDENGTLVLTFSGIVVKKNTNERKVRNRRSRREIVRKEH